MTEKLCVFISYKREDQATAERLWQQLGEWGYDRWLDVKDIRSGVTPDTSSWMKSVTEGLKQSDVLIGLITPNSLKSEPVNKEWIWAWEAKRRILLVRLQPYNPEDMLLPFAGTDYIDFVVNESKGLERLQRELKAARADRADFVREMIPPPAAPAPLPLPEYLRDLPATPRKYVPWRLTLRFLGIAGLIVSFIWLMFEPRFDSLLAFLGALAALLGSFVGEGEGQDLNRFSKLTDFEQMRKRVYQYWVQGVMQTALKEVETVGLALDMQPEAVIRDTRRKIGDIKLPNDSRHIRQVYDTFKSFLILGDPGAGKTIMLLQLAESLILKPPPTYSNAIPLVLNLSSWSLKPQPLQDWLEDEVWRSYRVRGNRVQRWLADDRLILLLDGLDEVKEEGGQRAACVEAINAFRKAYPQVPLVVCSRKADYERLGETQLALPGAILLESLTDEQVNHYLSDPVLAHLKRVVDDDPVLKEMSTTPFLLNTMIYAYRHEPEAALRGFETEADRRKHLFDTYVARRFDDNPPPYSKQQSLEYLRWLATKMQAYVQSVFHLEDVQPHWMADDQWYARMMIGLRVAYAIVMTLLYATVGWQLNTIVGGVSYGVAGALIGGLIAYWQRFRIRSRNDSIWKLENVGASIVLYLIAVLALSLVMLAIDWLSASIPAWAAWLLINATTIACLTLLFTRNSRAFSAQKRDETFFNIAIFAGFELFVVGQAWSLSFALTWPIWVEYLLVAFLIAFVLLNSLVFEEQSKAGLPPLRMTFLQLMVIVTLAGLICAVIGLALSGSILMGLAAALTYAGLFNVLTLLHWPLIWLRIRLQNRLPLRSEVFLEAMTERQILRSMGGGYIFIHRFLLENFAGLDEVVVLIEQLGDLNESTQQKALDSLAQVGRPALIPLTRSLQTGDLKGTRNLHIQTTLKRILSNLDSNEPREGIGLIQTRKGKLVPDVAWINIADDGEWLYQERKYSSLPAYQIIRYPITYDQFQTFIDDYDGFYDRRWWEGLADNQYRRNNQSESGKQRFQRGNHPRENVSWYDAIAFCRWWSWCLGGGYDLTKIQDWAVRLPTEYEWEKAARGREGLIYPYGNKFDINRANTYEMGIKQTSPVGLFPTGKSPYGVEEMSGNVQQWCLSEEANPKLHAEDEDLQTNALRTLRGGSYTLMHEFARATYRTYSHPYSRFSYIGFRVVRSVFPPEL